MCTLWSVVACYLVQWLHPKIGIKDPRKLVSVNTLMPEEVLDIRSELIFVNGMVHLGCVQFYTINDIIPLIMGRKECNPTLFPAFFVGKKQEIV